MAPAPITTTGRTSIAPGGCPEDDGPRRPWRSRWYRPPACVRSMNLPPLR